MAATVVPSGSGPVERGVNTPPPGVEGSTTAVGGGICNIIIIIICLFVKVSRLVMDIMSREMSIKFNSVTPTAEGALSTARIKLSPLLLNVYVY